MARINFHARKTQDGKQFICNQCSGPVDEKPGAHDRPSLNFVMRCKTCDIVVGEWGTSDERARFLREMPAS